MLGPLYKLLNICMNLLPFALIIWGFQSMTWNTISAASVHTFRTFIEYKTCGLNRWEHQCTDEAMCNQFPPARAFQRDCNNELNNYPFDWNRNLQVTDLQQAKENWDETGIIMVAAFSFLNLIWMAIYLKNSGVFSHSFGTVGYHYKNVRAMRKRTYKYFGYFLVLVLAGFLAFGVISINDDDEDEESTDSIEQADKDNAKSRMLTIYFNGVFQCLMGFVALLTTVEDTVEYGEKLMNLKLKSQPWQKSHSVMEKFQDALSAARTGDREYLKELTDCGEGDIDHILNDVTAIKFELSCLQKVKNFILCKGGQQKNDEVNMTNITVKD